MSFYNQWLTTISEGKKQLAILIDPEKFVLKEAFAKAYLLKIPVETTHIFVGGSTDDLNQTDATIRLLKQHTTLPIVLFPGDYTQLTPSVDGILLLSLISGRNPEYLIQQHVNAAPILHTLNIEIIPTGYILVDGGKETAVQRISKTQPIDQAHIDLIKHTALAGQHLGKKCIYLEAGSGALNPVRPEVIKAVKELLEIPLIVGGGIRSKQQLQDAYDAGANIVVIGTAFENQETLY